MQLHPHLYKKFIEYTENKISRAPFTLYFDCIFNFTLRFLFLIKFPNLFFNLFHFLFSILFSLYFHIYFILFYFILFYFILFGKISIFVIFYNNYVSLTKNWKQLYCFSYLFFILFFKIFSMIWLSILSYSCGGYLSWQWR